MNINIKIFDDENSDRLQELIDTVEDALEHLPVGYTNDLNAVEDILYRIQRKVIRRETERSC